MKARFAVDWDGTITTDDKYPAMGEWLPGAAKALHALSRIGQVVIYTCRVAPAHHITEEPRPEWQVNAEIAAIRDKLAEEGLQDLEIWTKPYKPPATVYIDNRAIQFTGDWDDCLEDILDAIAPIGAAQQRIVIDEIVDNLFVAHGKEPLNTQPLTLFDDTEPEPEECWCGGDCPCGEDAEDDNYEAFIQDMGACVDCPHPEGCPINARECDPGWGIDRHPSSARFHEILKELGELHDQKSLGYGTSKDPLANVQSSTEWCVPAWVGAMIRATDKIRRLQAYAQKGELPFEAVEDAFKDLGVYSIIGLVLFEQEVGAKREEIANRMISILDVCLGDANSDLVQ